MRFVVAAYRREKTLAELCREFGISRPVGYEWLKRYRPGRSGSDRGMQPAATAQSAANGREAGAASGGVAAAVSRLGSAQAAGVAPGGNRAAVATRCIAFCCGVAWCTAQIGIEPAVQRFERSAPNELWQMDFKSPKGWHQPVGPLSVIDDASRYAIALDSLASTRAEVVRERLVTAFCDCGVPDAMLMDHGLPWWNVQRGRDDAAVGVADAARHPALLQRRAAPADAGQGGAVPRRAGGALARRRGLVPDARAGSTTSATSTTICGRTRRWRCRLRPASGDRSERPYDASHHAGNIRRQLGC